MFRAALGPLESGELVLEAVDDRLVAMRALRARYALKLSEAKALLGELPAVLEPEGPVAELTETKQILAQDGLHTAIRVLERRPPPRDRLRSRQELRRWPRARAASADPFENELVLDAGGAPVLVWSDEERLADERETILCVECAGGIIWEPPPTEPTCPRCGVQMECLEVWVS